MPFITSSYEHRLRSQRLSAGADPLTGLGARAVDFREIVPASRLGWLATDCLFDYICNGSDDRHLCNCGHNRLSDVAIASFVLVGVGN